MIEVEGLCKSYGAIRAVDQATFTVRRGEILGFLGPNAAGKTTTMRILTCFLQADAGRATVAGHDVAREPVEVRRRIGYLPENNPLYLDMEVTEYLRFVAAVRRVPGPERRARIAVTVERCGLGGVVGRPIGALSKGYRQRVGLAGTLVHDPEVLILDEPTTGLDPNQIVEIRDLIREVGREKTVILSSHILPEVEATCERLAIINEGRIAAVGTPQELARQVAGGESLALLVRGAGETFPAALAALEGVAAVEEGPGEGEARRFAVRVAEGGDPRGAIFACAVREGGTILEMARRQASLEDVFRRLTAAEAPRA